MLRRYPDLQLRSIQLVNGEEFLRYTSVILGTPQQGRCPGLHAAAPCAMQLQFGTKVCHSTRHLSLSWDIVSSCFVILFIANHSHTNDHRPYAIIVQMDEPKLLPLSVHEHRTTCVSCKTRALTRGIARRSPRCPRQTLFHRHTRVTPAPGFVTPSKPRGPLVLQQRL